MPAPTSQLTARPAFWILTVIPVLVVVLLYRLFSQEIAAMRFNPTTTFMAALVASLARHGTATSTVDLSWHAPSATEINNLTQVIGGSGVYGFIFNSSTTPAHEYGTYNWCNMPHVRATEYKKPSSEYKLQYVEVVSCSGMQLSPMLTRIARSTDITNEPCMPQTPSPSSRTAGIVTTRDSSTTDNQQRGGSRLRPTGRDTSRPPTPSYHLVS